MEVVLVYPGYLAGKITQHRDGDVVAETRMRVEGTWKASMEAKEMMYQGQKSLKKGRGTKKSVDRGMIRPNLSCAVTEAKEEV